MERFEVGDEHAASLDDSEVRLGVDGRGGVGRLHGVYEVRPEHGQDYCRGEVREIVRLVDEAEIPYVKDSSLKLNGLDGTLTFDQIKV